MQIEDLPRDACLNFIRSRHLGRLACSNKAEPYVTPCTYVLHEQSIYSFGTVGRRIEWLRSNPAACLLVDDIKSPTQWTSVVVRGRYHELVDLGERNLAHHVLSKYPEWWQPGYTRTIVQGAARQMEPVFFRMSIDEISGRFAQPEWRDEPSEMRNSLDR